MKRRLKKNFPGIPSHYDKRVDQILEKIDPSYTGQRRDVRWHRVLAGSAAAVFLCVFLFLAEFPSYAVDIPILNRIIYTISPQVNETGEGEEKVAWRTAEVLEEFMESPIVMYTGQEDTGKSWQLNTNTLQAAYYFKNKVLRYLQPENAELPQAEITVRKTSAVRKSYEIMAEVTCDVLVDGTYCFTENLEVQLIERRGYLTVIGMSELGISELEMPELP